MSAAAEALSPKQIGAAGLCIGCGACTVLQPGATIGWDRDGQLKPAAPADWLRRKDPRLSAICPFSPAAADEDAIAAEVHPGAPQQHAAVGRYLSAYVGHVAEHDFRANGSSGGLVSWVAAELLREGLVDGVAHVVPQSRDAGDGRLFAYAISRNEAQLSGGAKSRYHPVELSDVLREIAATPGRYAIVGIPCFIKAVHLLRRHDPVLRERIAFTIGLFCGHMKSRHMVDSFAHQLGAAPEDVAAIDYRLKNPARPANWYTAQLTLRDGSNRQQDWWHLAEGDWGAGFFMNSACNYCDDVVAETADISMGDAWVEPYSNNGNGTNVAVVRSPVVEALVAAGIAAGRLQLKPVDADFVQRTQAAGLRQRREGLAYRLALRRRSLQPRKRVAPSRALPGRRKLIYRMRLMISRGSARLYRLSQAIGAPGLYLRWAKLAQAAYHGFAYASGPVGKFVDRWLDPKNRHGD